ncbi:hypothetical protein GLOIN_2v1765706 [Rhizophagus irregularis DAOM 181602=DAOM 197198]|nr:hypothetical protein GLOIN_2v1765706 [Rhizophagus irregularis DAOM 181602=DAOM 197198]
MKMVADQNHSSDSTPTEQEVIRRTEKIAKLLGTDKQNAEVYITLSDENRVLKKQLEEYHSQHNTLERRVKRVARLGRSILRNQNLLEDKDKLPYSAEELREEIWPDGIDKNEIKVDDADEVDKFRYGLLLQGEDSIDCHQKVKGISKDLDVIMITILILDKMVEMLIQAEKENVPDFITAFSDCLRQFVSSGRSPCEKQDIKHVGVCGSSANFPQKNLRKFATQ